MRCHAKKLRNVKACQVRMLSIKSSNHPSAAIDTSEGLLPPRKLLLDLPNKLAQDEHWYKVKATRPSKGKREVWDKSRREIARDLFGETLNPGLPKEIHELVKEANQTRVKSRYYDQKNPASANSSPESQEIQYGVPNPRFDTFEKCFLRKSVIDALSKAYPHITHPNLIQSKIFPVLADDKTDVIIKALTGTGKSFALALYLFNKQRSITSSQEKGDQKNNPSLTSLILVPGPELAMQYEEWITNILGTDLIPHSIVQTLYRTSASQEVAQLERLRDHPNPHILIATPTRLLDLAQGNLDLLDWNSLKVLAIDEADQLLEPLKRNTTSKQAYQRQRHPPPTQYLVEFILSRRTNRMSFPGSYSSQDLGRFTRAGGLRLIMVSATANSQLRHLVEKLLWVNRREKLRTIGFDDPQTHFVSIVSDKDPVFAGDPSSNTSQPVLFAKRTPASISHHVLKLTRNGKTYKLTDAALPIHIQKDLSLSKTATSSSSVTTDMDGVVTKQLESSLLLETYRNQSRPVDREWIRALKAVIEMDNITTAIVFIQHSVSRKKFVEAAHLGGLPYVSELRFPLPTPSTNFDYDERKIWVAQPLMTRGLDIPLTHVIIFNAPEDSTRYIHMAGRTGRHGASGKCITILTWEEDIGPSLINIERTLGERFSKIGVLVKPFFETKVENTDIVDRIARKELEWQNDQDTTNNSPS